jgi:hypothetical protein
MRSSTEVRLTRDHESSKVAPFACLLSQARKQQVENPFAQHELPLLILCGMGDEGCVNAAENTTAAQN